MEKPPSKPVGIWIRVSTEDQARGESPEHHERRARFYAESKDWKVREVYHLEAVSGRSVMDHPETQRMLGDVKSGRIQALIFSKLARLARNTRELLDFADLFREYEADLISLQESIDTSTPAGRLFYTMIAAMAQWEREEIADRVAASVTVRAKLGKPTGGQAPFGYQWVDKKLVPHPQEAPVRRLMYELFAEHQRMKTVARLLNEAGHRTRNGSQFTGTTVERLLLDPTAKGMRRANYTRATATGKKWVFKPESDWVWIPVEPIVAEDLWDRCNRILEGQRKKEKRASRKAVHLFSGLAVCHCGGKMYVPASNPKYTCAKCRNKIPQEDLEAVFHDQLKGFVSSSEEVARYFEESDGTIREKQALLQALEEEQANVRAEMQKTYRLYIDDKLTPDGFGDIYKPLEARLKQIEAQIPELQGEVDFLKIQHFSSDEVLTEARDLHNRWPELSSAEKRRIVEAITDKITVGEADVTIDLLYFPSSLEFTPTELRNNRDSWPPSA